MLILAFSSLWEKKVPDLRLVAFRARVIMTISQGMNSILCPLCYVDKQVSFYSYISLFFFASHCFAIRIHAHRSTDKTIILLYNK